MRTVTITLYEIDELSPEAKRRAREWWREHAFDDGLWADATLEDAKTCLALAGFTITEILYSGFYSQGDGACFDGSWSAGDAKPVKAMHEHAPQDRTLHEIAARARRIARKHRQATATIRHDRRERYYHALTVDFIVEVRPDEPAGEALENEVKELGRDAMRWIFSQLVKEYEYFTSDEQIDYMLRANEYEFYEDGRRSKEPRAA